MDPKINNNTEAEMFEDREATATTMNIRKEIKEKERELEKYVNDRKRICDHKTKHGPCVESVHTSNKYIPGVNDMSPNAVICKECDDIFDAVGYTPEEVEEAVYKVRSMLNQIKIFASMDDREYDAVVQLLTIIDTDVKGSLIPYYNKMVEKLAGNSKRRQESTNTKGRISIGGGSYGPSSKSFN